MNDPGEITPAQKEAFKRACDILTEHFDKVIVAWETEVEIEEEGKSHRTDVFMVGGASAAVGLCERFKWSLLHGD